jgi:hypothetical protein
MDRQHPAGHNRVCLPGLRVPGPDGPGGNFERRGPKIDNSDKIILDLCGGTGAWSRPYREAGYDARLITLPDNDVLTYEPPENVYGILAAPPCTQFSLARTTASTPRNFDDGMAIVQTCLCIIWKCRKEHKLGFWAMENPRGLLRQFLGQPAFEFEQWEFGDHGVKPTDIWGWFRKPIKTVIDRPENLTRKYPCGSSMSAYWNQKPPDGLTRADMRAITPPGFAQAFFKANR